MVGRLEGWLCLPDSGGKVGSVYLAVVGSSVYLAVVGSSVYLTVVGRLALSRTDGRMSSTFCKSARLRAEAVLRYSTCQSI